MTRISASELRKDTAEALNRVAYGKDRIVLHRRDKDVAVLISMEDYTLLRDLENRLDVEAIRKSKAKKGRNVAWEDLKAECGL
jgi:prevent-host-death family protein